MIAILKKEIKTFFVSPIGYLVIAVFLVLNGLFLWVFNGTYNIFDTGLASLNPYFELAPWVLLFLVPAVTMKSFSEEKKQGTLELLLTKPLSHWQLVCGKFMGAFILVIMAIIPTTIYIYGIYELGNPTGNIDFGSTTGSYIGLLFLVGLYAAIGVFASALTDNQIVAFILGVFLCFFFYFGFEGLSNYTFFGDVVYTENLGILAHYKSMSKGILDSRDLVYFLSLSALFLLLTVLKIKNTNS